LARARRKRNNLNVRVDDKTLRILERVARHQKVSVGEAVRSAIHGQYDAGSRAK
jgi:predicted HicB family RNase H-like nuclease